MPLRARLGWRYDEDDDGAPVGADEDEESPAEYGGGGSDGILEAMTSYVVYEVWRKEMVVRRWGNIKLKMKV